jgi:hypothetical protein
MILSVDINFIFYKYVKFVKYITPLDKIDSLLL